MTSDELEAMKKRVDAAAPGPWYMEDHPRACSVYGGDGFRIYDEGGHSHDDAVFIAHARQDIPALLAEVERLREALRVYADPSNWVEYTDGVREYAEWNGHSTHRPWLLAHEALAEDR